MLGKTHVVNALALFHASVVGYTAYLHHKRQHADEVGLVPFEQVQFFGFRIGEPLAITSYCLMLVTVVLFVLWLFRIGRRRWRRWYLGGMAFCLFALAVLFDTLYPLEMTVFVMAFAFGSMLPDVDSEQSTLGRYTRVISQWIPHRTYTHTIWVVIALIIVAFIFTSPLIMAVVLGYTVHIIQDSFSRQGVCWFYPLIGSYEQFDDGGIVKRNRKLPRELRYRTGGTGEKIVYYGSLVVHVLCVGFVIWYNVL